MGDVDDEAFMEDEIENEEEDEEEEQQATASAGCSNSRVVVQAAAKVKEDEQESAEEEEEEEANNSDSSGLGADDVVLLHEPEPSASGEKEEQDVFPYWVLTVDDISKDINNLISEISNIVQIPNAVSRLLLHHFKWSKEKLLETFYEYSDPDRLFEAAHVVSPFSRRAKKQVSGSSASKKPTVIHCNANNEVCSICFVAQSSSELSGLECGHRFCKNCWNDYLTTKVMDEGKGQTIACPAFNCGIFVDEAKALQWIAMEKVRSRYRYLMTLSFVSCNRLVRWCPSPDCQYVIKVHYFDSKPVRCKCSFVFCFACGHEWHEPVICRLLKLWIKKCNDDSETSNWIAANTKECPKCHVTIEKNGGCNHMTCKNVTCKQEFCWVCLGPWEPHGSAWYACNKFNDDAAKAARDAQERSRAALQRYLHYCNRYMNHQQSLKLENKLYAQMTNKMNQMQRMNMSWIEVQFLRQAFDVLGQCRRTLMYTYAFAYYLVKNNQSEIFEDNQRDLEMATEQLSEFLERDLNQEALVTLKQKVQDKCRYVSSRRKKLLLHCGEGEEKEWWQYTD